MDEEKDEGDEMVVRIKLRRHVAEKFRRMCHAQDMTASHMVDRWIFEYDEEGNRRASSGSSPARPRSLFETIFGEDK